MLTQRNLNDSGNACKYHLPCVGTNKYHHIYIYMCVLVSFIVYLVFWQWVGRRVYGWRMSLTDSLFVTDWPLDHLSPVYVLLTYYLPGRLAGYPLVTCPAQLGNHVLSILYLAVPYLLVMYLFLTCLSRRCTYMSLNCLPLCSHVYPLPSYTSPVSPHLSIHHLSIHHSMYIPYLSYISVNSLPLPAYPLPVYRIPYMPLR